jgi:methylmalonyl-CoA mutase cobalamin-binding subunit
VNDSKHLLRNRLVHLLAHWQKTGTPTRSGFQEAAEEIIRWKKKNGITGLWENPPTLVTATIDDAWGHGLAVIHLWAKAAGMKIHAMGLLKTPEEIITKCRKLQPDFLGMTILQFDTEDDLAMITRNLPTKTCCIVGGPIFKADPELASRAGVHMVAGNAADFLAVLLNFEPVEG